MGGCLCNSKAGGKGKEDQKHRAIATGASDDVVIRDQTKKASSDRRSILASLIAANNPVEWPPWLMTVAGDALVGWIPRKSNSFQKLSKIGEGTYSNVYKAKDLETGKIVALKKVRFDSGDHESINFMAREITLLRRLDHPNIIKLEGLVISRVSCSIYLVFEYMEHDLTGLAASPDVDLTLPQIKCYMKQLLSGLEHSHSQGVLHRDIKGSNLLIDNQGVLKIGDFGLASSYDPEHQQPMTSQVVTLWYRPPELILGGTYYGASVDLWSAGCVLGELLAKKPILPGRTEMEQLHKIFKLCGSPSAEYFKKSKLPHADIIKTEKKPHKSSIPETFRDFPSSSIPLIQTLLSIEPAERGTATSALNSEFFSTQPYACEPKKLPQYHPSKEMDIRHMNKESRRKNTVNKRGNGESKKKINPNGAVRVPQANARLQNNLNRMWLMARTNTSKSEKFPPPHQDGSLGFPLDNEFSNFPRSFNSSFESSDIFEMEHELKPRKIRHRVAPSQIVATGANKYHPSSIHSIGDLQKKNNNELYRREKGKELEVYGESRHRVAPSQIVATGANKYHPSSIHSIGDLQKKNNNELYRREKGKELEVYGERDVM